MQKNISSIIVKIKSSNKKVNKINYINYFSQYNTTNSTSFKENKKIIFQRKENNKMCNNSNNSNNTSKIEKDKDKDKKRQNININNIIINNLAKEKIPKLDISTHLNMLSFKDDLEVNNIETDIYKLMNEHKELTTTIISEDKTTEKDLYLENNNNDNNIKNDKNLVDYFKTARKALKSMSHLLVDPINNKNNIFNENDIKNKLNERGQKSNRNKEDDLHNYTINIIK